MIRRGDRRSLFSLIHEKSTISIAELFSVKSQELARTVSLPRSSSRICRCLSHARAHIEIHTSHVRVSIHHERPSFLRKRVDQRALAARLTRTTPIRFTTAIKTNNGNNTLDDTVLRTTTFHVSRITRTTGISSRNRQESFLSLSLSLVLALLCIRGVVRARRSSLVRIRRYLFSQSLLSFFSLLSSFLFPLSFFFSLLFSPPNIHRNAQNTRTDTTDARREMRDYEKPGTEPKR